MLSAIFSGDLWMNLISKEAKIKGKPWKLPSNGIGIGIGIAIIYKALILPYPTYLPLEAGSKGTSSLILPSTEEIKQGRNHKFQGLVAWEGQTNEGSRPSLALGKAPV